MCDQHTADTDLDIVGMCPDREHTFDVGGGTATPDVEQPPDVHHQLVRCDRLREEVVDLASQRPDSNIHARVRCRQRDRDRGPSLLHLGDEVEPRSARQADVDDHRVPLPVRQQFDCLGRRAGDGDHESCSLERSTEEGRSARIVFDDHHTDRCRRRSCGVEHHSASVASTPLTVVRRSGICSTRRNGSLTQRLAHHVGQAPRPGGENPNVVVGHAAPWQGLVDRARSGAGDDGRRVAMPCC